MFIAVVSKHFAQKKVNVRFRISVPLTWSIEQMQ